MENPGDSPNATGRRVRAFVITGLVALVVVGIWPLKGYRIDEIKFVDALASPYVGARHASSRTEDGKPGRFEFFCAKTALQAREAFDGDTEEPTPVVFGIREHDAVAYDCVDDYFDAYVLVFRKSNVTGSVMLPFKDVPPGKDTAQLAHECLTAILDGIDREIPGVTPFYNPPARQLWIDRVRPFLDKHFPKKPGP